MFIKENYIQIKYNDVENITWDVTYQRNLSNNMQVSVTYDGRVSGNSKVINTGGMQVRAYF